MRNMDAQMQMHLVRGLHADSIRRAEQHALARSHRDRAPKRRRQRRRPVAWFIRRLRPAVHQEVR